MYVYILIKNTWRHTFTIYCSPISCMFLRVCIHVSNSITRMSSESFLVTEYRYSRCLNITCTV